MKPEPKPRPRSGGRGITREGRLMDEERKALADRAAEVWKEGGLSYSQAIDAAMGEVNPTADPGTGEKLLYALLNVPEEVPGVRVREVTERPPSARVRPPEPLPEREPCRWIVEEAPEDLP